MNKNQKRSITRSYNARLYKVLEITRHKPLFPTAILTLVFNFAKSMAIGEKMTQLETKKGKTEMHQCLLIMRFCDQINTTTMDDLANKLMLERVVDFLTIVPWPLSEGDKAEYNLLKECVHDKFLGGAPAMFLLTLEERFVLYPFVEAEYAPEKWLR